MGIIKSLTKRIRSLERSMRYARQQAKGLAAENFRFEQEMTSFKVLWDNFSSCSKKSICYFSSFDADGLVDDYVIFHLKALKAMGMDVVFISSSPSVADRHVEALKNHVAAIIHRNNIGLDFFSWKIGMCAFPFVSSTEQVILANDSVYGPLFSLSTVFQKMKEKNLDVWGITDSWFTTYHLQSYFICINITSMTSNILRSFFDNVKIIDDKVKLIVEYEMGLTKSFLSEGLKVGALCDFREIYKQFYSERIKNDRLTHFAHATNPTVNFWKELIVNHLSPYLKTSVLREDYLNEIDPRNLEELFGKIKSDLSLAIVIDHQKRVSNGNFP